MCVFFVLVARKLLCRFVLGWVRFRGKAVVDVAVGVTGLGVEMF